MRFTWSAAAAPRLSFRFLASATTGPPQILWAGGLDGDRVADVLVELHGYPGSRRAVFLSSFAEPRGSLVAKAASLDTAGC